MNHKNLDGENPQNQAIAIPIVLAVKIQEKGRAARSSGAVRGQCPMSKIPKVQAIMIPTSKTLEKGRVARSSRSLRQRCPMSTPGGRYHLDYRQCKSERAKDDDEHLHIFFQNRSSESSTIAARCLGAPGLLLIGRWASFDVLDSSSGCCTGDTGLG